MKRIIALLSALAVFLSLAACTQQTQDNSTGAQTTTLDTNDMFTDRDLSGEYKNPETITLSGSETVTITGEGVYLLTGSLSGASVQVNAKDAKVQLVLDGVDISDGGIYILDADKVFLTLADGSENTVTGCAEAPTIDGYTINGAIYSRSDLTVNGSGKLTVTASSGHGITCKDDLAITGGVLQITSANHALDANDSVRICGGELALTAGKDGIHAENTDDTASGFVYISGGRFDVQSEGDGISAGAEMMISGGTFTVLAGGGYKNGTSASSDGYGQMPGGWGGGHGGPGRSAETTTTETDSDSMKGLKSTAAMQITGGEFTLDTADDSLHSDESITIDGGVFTIYAGDDAVHAENTLTINTCEMDVEESYEGLEAEYIYVHGGTFRLNCSDDGLNASGGNDSSGTTGGRDGKFGGAGGMGAGSGHIEITGGSFTIYSCGDGLDSNGSLTISGGEMYVTNPSSGDVSVLDSQQQPVITGGTYIGLGVSTMMAQTFASSSTQGVIACTCSVSAGTQVSITDADGNSVMSFTAEYTTKLMILSSPQITKGQSYTITAGDITGSLTAS